MKSKLFTLSIIIIVILSSCKKGNNNQQQPNYLLMSHTNTIGNLNCRALFLGNSSYNPMIRAWIPQMLNWQIILIVMI